MLHSGYNLNRYNMDNICSRNMGGYCNNMGMIPHSNKGQGYIPHIPSLKEIKLLKYVYSSYEFTPYLTGWSFATGLFFQLYTSMTA